MDIASLQRSQAWQRRSRELKPLVKRWWMGESAGCGKALAPILIMSESYFLLPLFTGASQWRSNLFLTLLTLELTVMAKCI